MKTLRLTVYSGISALALATAAQAATYPTFVFDAGASSINLTKTGDLCLGCGLSASFSAGVDGWTWTPSAPDESATISKFIDWKIGAGLGGETYDVSATLAFSSPSASSSTTGGSAIVGTILGIVSGGILTWNSGTPIVFSDGSVVNVSLHGTIAGGFGKSTSTGVTFTGAPISPVPLPAAGLLLLAGLGGLGLASRRKKAA